MPTSRRRRVLGSRVRDLRAAGDEHQEAFAARAHVSARTLWAIEHDVTPAPQPVTIARIAAALGVSIGDITEEVDVEDEPVSA